MYFDRLFNEEAKLDLRSMKKASLVFRFYAVYLKKYFTWQKHCVSDFLP